MVRDGPIFVGSSDRQTDIAAFMVIDGKKRSRVVLTNADQSTVNSDRKIERTRVVPAVRNVLASPPLTAVRPGNPGSARKRLAAGNSRRPAVGFRHVER
mgnify:FL=1